MIAISGGVTSLVNSKEGLYLALGYGSQFWLDANGGFGTGDICTYSGGSSLACTLDTLAELNTALGGINIVDTGTLTDTKYCTWDATGSEIDCDSEGGSGGVSGPVSSTDNAIMRWDGAGGDTAQDSVITSDDTTGALAFPDTVTINSGEADGATAKGFVNNTTNTLSTGGSLHSEWTNNGTSWGFKCR